MERLISGSKKRKKINWTEIGKVTVTVTVNAVYLWGYTCETNSL